jgi:hypothetical protein
MKDVVDVCLWWKLQLASHLPNLLDNFIGPELLGGQL